MWPLFHAYNRLVAEGKVKPIICPDDGFKLTTMLNPDNRRDDSVWLWCAMCDTMTSPGLAVVQQVKAVVAEHLE